ncbi:hypothetical protein ABW636_16960 [Aquimarina sp. 2201CG1-2-11]|uniref:hypothetical protein n=1 Tax=Aquimarina discodermiae TaxID=3231043 RepID=UPI003463588F
MKIVLNLFLMLTTISCSADTNDSLSNDEVDNVASNEEMASIVSVASSGTENNYTFSVGISSPDTGCSQYANWWEVVKEDGTLLYRRILGHSHVNEQPFVRSGGTIDIPSDQVVIVRAHMNTSGYGIKAFIGSVSGGFKETILENGFAENLATVAPQPDKCAF